VNTKPTVKRMDRLPNYVESAVQGLAFWIGHRRCIYPDYDLGEAALVAELANLMQLRLPNDQRLMCEVHHHRFLPTSYLAESLSRSTRADLVVGAYVDGRHKESSKVKPQAVIEVKRWSAEVNLLINRDLVRLCEIKLASPSVRCWLILICQGRLPARFINSNGTARRARLRDGLKKSQCFYKVRRVCMATASSLKRDKDLWKKKNSCHCCVIEVFKSN
jgi:hypothetical protein